VATKRLAKDSWMLAIGTALVLDAVFGSRRKKKKS
jgi:LPXTG-motif cell wall-anchored protein